MSTVDQQRLSSALAPLRQPLFRALWIASVVSNIGTWMQEVGEGWLMTTLTASPTLIGLLETAITLPVFLFALPAGALADIIDRRRLLILTQLWMLVAAAILGVLALIGAVTPVVVLALTFLLSMGMAMNGPAWQATMPDLVTSSELPAAIALGSVAFNVARAVGPALGGIVIAAAGAWAAFILNAVSFLGVIIVLARWRREHHESILPAERVMGAMRAGLRFVRHAPILQAVLIRTGAFVLFASAMWATLPYLARHEMGLNALQYGMLIGFFGTGAVLGAVVLARVRQRISIDNLIAMASILFAVLLGAFGFVRVFLPVGAAMFVGGMSWMVMLSILNTAALDASPSWVRARAMAVYLVVFMGGFALGGFVWGLAATHVGLPATMSVASAGMVLGLIGTRRYRMVAEGRVDLTPSLHWPEPVIAFEPHPDQGPVLVTVEYQIKPGTAQSFLEALHALGKIRKRDGAVQWGIFKDVSDPHKYVETFVVESWVEHLRQHRRVTVTDREVEEQAHSYHVGPGRPKVTHLIYSDEIKDTSTDESV